MIYILTVYLVLAGTNPTVWLLQEHKTMEECQRWATFYNEYPFMSICTRERKL